MFRKFTKIEWDEYTPCMHQVTLQSVLDNEDLVLEDNEKIDILIDLEILEQCK